MTKRHFLVLPAIGLCAVVKKNGGVVTSASGKHP